MSNDSSAGAFALSFSLYRAYSDTLTRRDRHAAVGHDDGADDKARTTRGKKGDDLGDFLWLRGAADRCSLAVLGQKARAIIDDIIEDVGNHVTDTNGIHADAMLNGFKCQRAGQLRQRTF